jgi:ribonuclease E
MTKRMLIDATHAEETRVVVLDGNRLEDFDVETSTKKQLKGNIYLAKVVRVEPSLQAAFVEYGGGRHGFLAFGEIHPDYYQIPVADRQRLLAMQAEEARAEEEAADAEMGLAPSPAAAAAMDAPEIVHGEAGHSDAAYSDIPDQADAYQGEDDQDDNGQDDNNAEPPRGEARFGDTGFGELLAETGEVIDTEAAAESDASNGADDNGHSTGSRLSSPDADPQPPEDIGGDSDADDGNGAEAERQRRTARFLRNYRIQEVIRRRQILLIQVVKEERGNKGAALTTYISLAGRFCVLMPNSPRGGGISRKITSAADRRRLKEITAELEIPQGMGLIVRTAGANRPKPEIRRDCEYLMRLWDDIREHTMASMAPALIYEEASLIKRTIRDVYSRDIDEVYVDGEAGWRAAHDFMRMLMPSHAKKVQLWKPREQGGMPLFAKYQVDVQLDAMLSPNVQLKSGGYLVINQAEALVAIDVNSGRSTRERGIEETALRTNLEAADEVARQLRLRDLAGLIVIDFIDMDAKKHNMMVENRLKEALKVDRARIQLGHISHFGLMEMSRQRLRPSLSETTFVTCTHCQGLGLVRSVESSAIHVLRDIEEEGAKERASLILVHVANPVAMYILNNKREALAAIESRYAMKVHFEGDEGLMAPNIRIDRLKPPIPQFERIAAQPVAPVAPQLDAPDEEADAVDDDDAAEVMEAAAERPARAAAAAPAAATANGDEPRRRRRRRRRNGRREDGSANGNANGGSETDQDDDTDEQGDDSLAAADAPAEVEAGDATAADAETGASPEAGAPAAEELDENGNPRGRKRGRRGGRRRRRDNGDDNGAQGELAPESAAESEADAPAAPRPAAPRQIQIQPAPAYTGPTPANPFGTGAALDIFDLMDRAEEAATPAPKRAPEVAPEVPAPAVTPERPIPEVTPEVPTPEIRPEQPTPEVTPEVPTPEVPAEVPTPDAPAEVPTRDVAAQELVSEADAPAPVRAKTPRAPSARTLAARAAKAARAEAAAAEAAAAEQAAEPVAAEAPAVAEPAVAEPAVAEPVVAEPVAVQPAAPEAAATATAEPPPASPAIKPLLVGEDVIPGAAPKRGWWRR